MPKLDSYICSGATLRCTCGDSNSTLHILPHKKVLITGEPMANICEHQSMVNIMPFGRCHTTKFPSTGAATSANHGKLTPMPCIPNTPSNWINGSNDTYVAHTQAVLSCSYLKCIYGGIISIVKDGQIPSTSVVMGNSELNLPKEVLTIVRPVDKVLSFELNSFSTIQDKNLISEQNCSDICKTLNESLLNVSRELSRISPIHDEEKAYEKIDEFQVTKNVLKGGVSIEVEPPRPTWNDIFQKIINKAELFIRTYFIQKSLLTISIKAEITNRRYFGLGFEVKLRFGINSNNQRYWGIDILHKGLHIGSRPINITATANVELNCKDPDYYDYWDSSSFININIEVRDLFSVDFNDNFIIGHNYQNPTLNITVNTTRGPLLFTFDFNNQQWYLPTVGTSAEGTILRVHNPNNKINASVSIGSIYSNTWLIE